MIKWNMNHEEANTLFEHGKSLNKTDDDHKHFVDEMQFCCKLQANTLRIERVILKKNTSTEVIEGLDLSSAELKFRCG